MDIQPADPAQRRRVVLALSATAAVLLAIIIAFEIWLHRVSAELDTAELIAAVKPMLVTCVILIVLCAAALGAHLLILGKHIVRYRRFPARAARTIRDTPVREGDAATRIGHAYQFAGWAFCAFSLLVMAFGWMWIGRFG